MVEQGTNSLSKGNCRPQSVGGKKLFLSLGISSSSKGTSYMITYSNILQHQTLNNLMLDHMNQAEATFYEKVIFKVQNSCQHDITQCRNHYDSLYYKSKYLANKVLFYEIRRKNI